MLGILGLYLLYWIDKPRKKKKKPPAPWARKSPLKKALKIQFGVIGTEPPLNPDEIFADITTCDLEKVFDMKKKRYQRRGSSGYWQTDRVTDDEKRAYARRMGFAPALFHKTCLSVTFKKIIELAARMVYTIEL